MRYAVLFPGQGSQYVGMGADVRDARRDLFEEAGGILGWDLDRLIAEGPDERLMATEHAQPALFVTAYALWLTLESLAGTGPAAAAGHSLGEYTALAAAGALSFEDAVELVAERGRAMAEADSGSGMAALIGADVAAADGIARDRRAEGGSLFVANVNAPGQIVVSGADEDIAWITEHARELGIRRAIPLNVSAGFHSPFMRAAEERLDSALDRVAFASPSFPVFANATAAPTTDPRATLSHQLTATVRFADSLENIAATGIDTFVHVGPGDVTAGLARRTVPGAHILAVSSLADASSVAKELSIQ